MTLSEVDTNSPVTVSSVPTTGATKVPLSLVKSMLPVNGNTPSASRTPGSKVPNVVPISRLPR